MVKRAWPIIREGMMRLFNAALEHGHFPRRWKRGELVIIKKAGNRDFSDPGSYRPICLQPVFGKVLETLVITRVMIRLRTQGRMSGDQYGFTEGRSVTDAINRAMEVTEMANEKYVLGIFLDIQGAFDNVWWPYVMHRLKEMDCLRNLYRIILDYFRDREVTLRANYYTQRKFAEKGCPQGSVMGQHLWNIVLDEVLKRNENVEKIAFADDCLLIVKDGSRLSLERKAQQAIDEITDWCARAKFKLSAPKTEMMFFKGKMDAERPPRIKINGTRIALKEKVRYLGVVLEGNRLKVNFNPHCQSAAVTAIRNYGRLRQLMGTGQSGYHQRAMLTLYKGAIVPILTYACSAWGDRITYIDKRALIRAQRNALRGITRMYSTTPTNSITVLTGLLPVDLLALQQQLRGMIRRGLTVKIGETVWTERGVRNDPDGVEKDLENWIVGQWQERWNTSATGLWTKEFFPVVNNKIRWKIIKDNDLCQMITGHGDFHAYLHRFGFRDNPACVCGEPETPKHMIDECPRYKLARFCLQQEIEATTGVTRWPVDRQILVNECLEHFQRFIHKIRKIRK
ncbi:hypothetical protein AAG570_004874 [Ranatra chinensis]|uniref:Reverse transcriptase domain-containing protein n=1 Tax=Ranatra chinensis TaxID=642074 RepID=A0ABD0Y0F6_9HEMI